jgi:hypothetical protein
MAEGLLGRNGRDQWCPVGPPPHRLKLVRRLIWVTNGHADNMSDTSEVPQLTDPLCATRKSAEVGQFQTSLFRTEL